MSYVYGPVPSRRLGQSLGVDPIPSKMCNYNCVYCQLGRTRPVTNERRDFFPPGEILEIFDWMGLMVEFHSITLDRLRGLLIDSLSPAVVRGASE
jgi:wyosine [tRNA(Phe)-imidazoG37] synthetase (radical SAM superfamily)